MESDPGSLRLGVLLAGTSGGEHVAGRTLIERSRELLARAGCAEILVVMPGVAPGLVPTLDRWEGGALVVAGDVVFDRDVLPALAARGEGAFVCSRGFVLATSASRALRLARAHGSSGTLAAPTDAEPGRLLPAGTSDERSAAARALLAGTRKPEDGPMRRLFERRLGALLAEHLVESPVTPNTVTAVSLAVGLLGALLLALPGHAPPVLGALLVVLAKVGDTCDGSLARAKLLESRGGDRLDTVSDIALSLCAFTAVGVHVVREDRSSLFWAVMLIAGVVLCCVAHETFRHLAATGSLARLRGLMDRAALIEWGYPLLAFALVGSLDLFVVSAALAADLFALLYFAAGLAPASRYTPDYG